MSSNLIIDSIRKKVEQWDQEEWSFLANEEYITQSLTSLKLLLNRIKQYERWTQQELDLRGKEFLDWLAYDEF